MASRVEQSQAICCLVGKRDGGIFADCAGYVNTLSKKNDSLSTLTQRLVDTRSSKGAVTV